MSPTTGSARTRTGCHRDGEREEPRRRRSRAGDHRQGRGHRAGSDRQPSDFRQASRWSRRRPLRHGRHRARRSNGRSRDHQACPAQDSDRRILRRPAPNRPGPPGQTGRRWAARPQCPDQWAIPADRGQRGLPSATGRPDRGRALIEVGHEGARLGMEMAGTTAR